MLLLIHACARTACQKVIDNLKRKFCSIECKAKDQSEKSLVTLTCVHCQNPFQKQKSQVREVTKYCSRECQRLSQVDRITVACCVCKKEIEKKPYAAKQYSRHYCSIKCRRTGPTQVSLNCQGCGKEFQRKACRAKKDAKYCSRKCQHQGLSRDRSTHETVICSGCKKETQKPASRLKKYKRHYCSRACRKESLLRKLIAECRMRVVLDKKTWQERGLYNREIAEEVGCKETFVRQVLRELKMNKKPGQPTVYMKPEVEKTDPRKAWSNFRDISSLKNDPGANHG